MPELINELDFLDGIDLARELPVDALLQTALSHHREPKVRAFLASSANLLAAVAWSLAADPDLEVRAALAANPSLGEGLQARLAEDPNPWVIQALAQYVRSPTLQHRLARIRHISEETRSAFARNTSLSPEIQEQFARSPDKWVRIDLAANSGLTPTAMDTLARDSVDFVRTALAQNPSITAAVQLVLARDSHELARRRLAASPALLPTTALVLSTDASFEVQHALAQNPAMVPAPEMPVPFLKRSEAGRQLVAEVLTGCDEASRATFEREFEGTLRELRAVLESFSPERS